MIELPSAEKQAFFNLVAAQARQAGVSPRDYIRKIWYHEQAAKIGEYAALSLVEQLTTLIDNRTVDQGVDSEADEL